MAIDRSRQLAGMADALPRRNEQVAAAGRSAAELAIKQAASQMQPGAIATGEVQQMAGQAVAAKAQPELQAAQKNIQQQTQMAQMQLQQKQAEERKKEMQRRIGQMQKQREFQDLLASIDNKAKNELVDAQMKFQQDSFGRTKFTEQQLMDFALLQAKDDIDLQKYADDVRRATENEIYMLEVANKKLQQEIEQQLQLSQTRRDHAYLTKLQQKQHAIKKKIRKKQADKANRGMILGTVVGVIGGIVGGYFGGPMGAAAGFSGGQGLGTASYAAMGD